jgi:hypothetical protein
MLALRRALLTLLALGIVSAGLVATVTVASRHEPDKALAVLSGVVIGLSFIGVGLFAWWRRPAQPLRRPHDGRRVRLVHGEPDRGERLGDLHDRLVPRPAVHRARRPHGALPSPAVAWRRSSSGRSSSRATSWSSGPPPVLLLGGDISSDLEGARPENVLRGDRRSAVGRRLRLAGRLPGGGGPGHHGRDARPQAARRDRDPAPAARADALHRAGRVRARRAGRSC